MPNASPLEWAWTLSFLGALLFSILYMWKLVVRGVYIWRKKENGVVRSFWTWQFVITLYFVLSAVLFVVIGYLSMLTPPPIRASTFRLSEIVGYAFTLYAFAMLAVQWFIWRMDRNTIERATLAEKAIKTVAETIAIVEANTQAVEENTAAVEANTEQKG